ncbi:MAG: hypothetical protein GXP31_18660 [Kiritimatiellaeota bacterium]|nr:hypothetical protein [Kiritimatiellota bacterium]
MRRVRHFFCLAAAAAVLTARAQEWRNQTPAPKLLVRLVAVENDGGDAVRAGASEKLADILPLLRDNLRFRNYRLIFSRKLTLREGAVAELPGGLRMVLYEVRGTEFRVRVGRDRDRLIEARMRLRRGKPVILGGLPADGPGTLLLVLLLPPVPP